jgi:AcrR family transcriptional regulator
MTPTADATLILPLVTRNPRALRKQPALVSYKRMNRPEDARTRILAVASDLFARQGFDGTSVRDITARAAVNLGAITYHFGSKEALYHAVFEGIVAPLVQAVTSAAEHEGPALDRLESMVRALLRHVAANPGTPALLLRELTSHRPLPPPMAAAMKRNLGAIISAIFDGQRDGTVRAGDPVLLALSVVAQPFFFTVASRFIREASGVDRDDPAVRDRIVDHIATTVRRSVARQEA